MTDRKPAAPYHFAGRATIPEDALFVNPYTGMARDARDVFSDPYGALIQKPEDLPKVFLNPMDRPADKGPAMSRANLNDPATREKVNAEIAPQLLKTWLPKMLQGRGYFLMVMTGEQEVESTMLASMEDLKLFDAAFHDILLRTALQNVIEAAVAEAEVEAAKQSCGGKVH